MRGPLNLIWYIYPLQASGQMGEPVKYNVFCAFLFIHTRYRFSQTRLQVTPVDGFLRAITQDVKSRKDVSFGGYKT